MDGPENMMTQINGVRKQRSLTTREQRSSTTRGLGSERARKPHVSVGQGPQLYVLAQLIKIERKLIGNPS